jgi:uncharacterized protein (TIGR02246 family)
MMPNGDEQAIRDLVTQWLKASRAGDLTTVLGLMSDDVVFMIPGREPFGKREFEAANKAMEGTLVEGTSDIAELKVLGEWAWLRNRLRIIITPKGSKPVVHSGYTLTILRKTEEGTWVIARDANLLTPEPDA